MEKALQTKPECKEITLLLPVTYIRFLPYTVQIGQDTAILAKGSDPVPFYLTLEVSDPTFSYTPDMDPNFPVRSNSSELGHHSK